MKGYFKEMILILVLSLLIPLLTAGSIMRFNIGTVSQDEKEQTEDRKDGYTVPLKETDPPVSVITISVLLDGGTVTQMDLDEYVQGVVLKEMPADFEFEALKAQAVVARTYAMRGKTVGSKHENADVCTNSECCQAFCSREEYLAAGGDAEMAEKVEKSVTETKNAVLIYNGKLIEATYFSCSGGRTEDALAVWGSDVPYLQSVESPGEENAAHYSDTVTFSLDAFANCLNLSVPGSLEDWIGEVKYTQGRGVDTIQIGGASFTGKELRKLLGLRSTNFSINAAGDTVTVTTMGFGHRVGMSQYGADAMAATGETYESILAHYYPGTTLTVWIDKENALG